MIDLLILLLKKINVDQSITVINREYSPIHPLVDAAKYIACKYVDDNNMHDIIYAGFSVVSGKLSKFGWKKSYIILNRGIITYNITFPKYI